MLKNKKTLSILIILLIIIIAGILITSIKGLNYGLAYGNNTTIKITLNTNNQISELKNITTQVFGSNKLQQVDNKEDSFIIYVKQADTEKINVFISNVNEKFQTTITADDLEVKNNPKLSGFDLIKPYILPSVLSLALILIYFTIRYIKLGIIKICTETLSIPVVIQLVYFSIYAILRIPVNEITMPVSMLLFVLCFVLLEEKYNKK